MRINPTQSQLSNQFPLQWSCRKVGSDYGSCLVYDTEPIHTYWLVRFCRYKKLVTLLRTHCSSGHRRTRSKKKKPLRSATDTSKGKIVEA